MSVADTLRDLAESIGPPVDATLMECARQVEDQTAALEAAESALDHARLTADPETSRILIAAQHRAQRVLLAAA